MLPTYFEFNCPVKILSGRLALSNLPYELTQLGGERALIITDAGVLGAGLVALVEAVFADSDREIGVIFSDTPPDSSDRVVADIAGLFDANRCDCIVAVGGGSVLDTAKAVNILVATGGRNLLEMQGVDRVSHKLKPLVAVPTTAGTGSEVTNVAVISNLDESVKMGLVSSHLFPNVTILDPRMTLTMPGKITAASGMDALTHAMEAFYCLQKNPVSDGFAWGAVKLIFQHLETAVAEPENMDARMGMANAALIAGMAFSNSMVGMVHAIAHACGAIAHVPHGTANSILLPFGLEHNLELAGHHIAELTVPMGLSSDGSVAQRCQAVIDRVRQLAARLHELCGLPLTLSQARVKREQIPEIAKLSLDDGALTFNPEEVTYEQIVDIITRAF